MDTETRSELRKLYLGALNTVLQYGWRRDQLGDRNTGYCIVGAIDDYYTRSNPPYGVRNLAIRELEAMIGCEELHMWNDRYGTKERVVDFLLRGAEK